MKKIEKVVRAKAAPKVPISELNIRKTATRLLTVKLVSTEIAYVQRALGTTATQEQLDERVLAVRSMPWSSIALPD
ncbi:MAG TPA: hypothetical protein VEK79_19030 [Thermoanaerobaculia bacterium]|nr:hypothetical protein [Thermoanaerobaculia bacterium]